MQSINIIESTWLAWYQYLGNDLVAMGILQAFATTTSSKPILTIGVNTGMTIFWSHEAFNFLQYSFCLLTDGLFAIQLGPKYYQRKQSAMRSQQSWTQLLLLLDYTIEFPTIIAFHPMVSRYGINIGVPFPSIPHLAAQIAQCFLAEYACYRWLPRFLPSSKSGEESVQHENSTASCLATEYMVPRVALLLVLATVALPRLLGPLSGRLHFASIIAWMNMRRCQVFRPQCGLDADKLLGKRMV